MKAKTRRALLDGSFICPIAFQREYEYLLEPGNQELVNAWLDGIDMRLARIGADGAFFMAPRQLLPADTAKIRDDFARYRDVYGPACRMLQLIRTAKDEFTLGVGEYIQLAELNQAINESATVESQLRSLQSVIREGSALLSNSILLKRLLDHLAKDGYLVLVNANTEMYQTTGKVAQLSNVLTFLAENTDIAGALDEPDQTAADAGLFDN
jgi:hypothetical protein